MQQNPLTGPTTTAFAHIVTATSLVPQRGGVVVVQGGTYAGKTYAIMQLLALLAAQTPRTRITVVMETVPDLKAGAMADFEEIRDANPLLAQFFPDSKINKTERKFVAINGSYIVFKSYSTPRKAHGAKREYLYLNEANHINKAIYDQLKTRTNCITFIDHNPVSAYWAHDLAKEPYAKLVVVNHTHNEFCPAEKHAEIEAWKYTNPAKYRIYGLGKTGQVEGLVFKWKVADIPVGAKLMGYGMDFGSTAPSAIVALWKLGNDIWADEVLYQSGLLIDQMADAIRTHCERGYSVFADPGGLGIGYIKELRARGLNIVETKKGDGSILFGIDILLEKNLHITPRSVKLARELEEYYWPQNAMGQFVRGVPPSDRRHAIDSTRYVARMTLAQVTQNIGKSTFVPSHDFNVNA